MVGDTEKLQPATLSDLGATNMLPLRPAVRITRSRIDKWLVQCEWLFGKKFR